MSSTQDTSLDDYNYVENLEHDYGFSDKEMQGINRAFAQQRAKLFEQIRSEVIGDVETEQVDELEHCRNVLRTVQLEALTRVR